MAEIDWASPLWGGGVHHSSTGSDLDAEPATPVA
jgi:hypothetical protein